MPKVNKEELRFLESKVHIYLDEEIPYKEISQAKKAKGVMLIFVGVPDKTLGTENAKGIMMYNPLGVLRFPNGKLIEASLKTIIDYFERNR